MVRHVKLARDRRRKKLQVKAMIFFAAILLILIGVLLEKKQEQTEKTPASISTQIQENVQQPVLESADTNSDITVQVPHSELSLPEIELQSLQASPVPESAVERITSETTENKSTTTQIEFTSAESSPLDTQVAIPAETNTAKPHETEYTANNKLEVNSLDATSFYDYLEAKDDEVDEIKPDVTDELAEFPESARNALNDLFDVMDQAMRIKNQFSHTVVKGDTLKDVLEQSGLDIRVSDMLIKNYPEFKSLKPGQQFYWILDNQGELEYLNWLVSEREERIYEKIEDSKFKREILKKQSVWKKEVLKGKIDNSFNTTLRTLGLELRQINQLANALQWQINLKRLKKGDKFAVLVTREYIDNKRTGQGNVDGIHIISGGKSYYAIQASNGRYYNRQGETLGKGFARYPLQRQARVSSHFNPYRRHPVTGRIAPHKGVDFAMPVGTPIIAPADGIVEKVAYQANGAGRYIVIRHGREYQTVYMHLSRPLVRAGQNVKRGQRIALSGNTGRSTGPHLHYEFHINGRAVNPLSVKLPGTSSGMGTSERKQFLVRAKEVERQLKL